MWEPLPQHRRRRSFSSGECDGAGAHGEGQPLQILEARKFGDAFGDGSVDPIVAQVPAPPMQASAQWPLAPEAHQASLTGSWDPILGARRTAVGSWSGSYRRVRPLRLEMASGIGPWNLLSVRTLLHPRTVQASKPSKHRHWLRRQILGEASPAQGQFPPLPTDPVLWSWQYTRMVVLLVQRQ